MTRAHEAIALLWRRRNSPDPRLRSIARRLLRQDLRALRTTHRKPLP
jgi:hypothetical protein